MDKLAQIYEGKAKRVYATADPELLIQEFKDEATAFDGTKKGIIKGKGICNNQISQVLFTHLEKNGVSTHFIRLLSDRDMLIRKMSMLKIEVVVRNIAAGSLVRRLGLPEGLVLDKSILEFYYKNDALHDPLINLDHVIALKLASVAETEQIAAIALRINDVLVPYFAARGLRLVDYKLEFGYSQGQLLLGDEISPDTCRLWDAKDNTKLDKDRFRFDLGHVEEAYTEIYNRLKS